MSQAAFPFSAVIGQPEIKLALTLCAVDPKIGGVLLSGARGTAKSTIARALLDLMPPGGAFVSLPLGASEERICGTLDLQKALSQRDIEFSPGLLHRAHDGVLYVDEVNLLADHLVDLLLDVAASGVNTVERDGISHSHPASFVLVGTMNPEEGELRPQLLDRYGLCVHVGDVYSESERIAIVRARLAFDANPERFVRMFAEQQSRLIGRCQRAREQLSSVVVSDQMLNDIAARCVREHVEGVRADIVIHRAARAHAALNERDEVTTEDIDAVAEFAFAHRRRDEPVEQRRSQSPDSDTQQPQPPPNREQPSSGDWGEMPPVPIGVGDRRELNVAAGSSTVAKKKAR